MEVLQVHICQSGPLMLVDSVNTIVHLMLYSMRNGLRPGNVYGQFLVKIVK